MRYSHNIEAVEVEWVNDAEKPRAYKYKIVVSDDGVNYTTVVDKADNSTESTTRDIFNIVGRFVRIIVTGSTDKSVGAAAYEVRVFGTPGIPRSQGKPVKASTFQRGNVPENANDGDLTTRWAAVNNTYPQWWVVDLGSIRDLTGVDINWYGGTSRYYRYTIDVSDDGIMYTTVVNKTGNVTGDFTSDVFDAKARYVRVTVKGASIGSAYASAYEIRVYDKIGVPVFDPVVEKTVRVGDRLEFTLNATERGGMR